MAGVLVWLAVLALFVVGLAGIVIPGLPGVALIFAGVLVYAIATGFADIGSTALLVFGVLTALAAAADYFGPALGARYGGGGTKTIAGALIGALVGMFISPIGLLVGAFAGALSGALLEGKRGSDAATASLWAVLGVLGGRFVQLAIAVSMIVTFALLIAW